jgi:hypothetical protein
LAQGPTFGEGLANAARLGPAGQLIDQQYAKEAADKADRENKIKQSAADLAKFPDLVKYVTDTGDTAGAFSEAFKRGAPGYGDPNYGKDPADTYSGRLRIGKEMGLTGTDLGTYALTSKLPGGNQTARAGVGQPIPFRNKKTGELVGAQPMTVGPAVNTITGQPFDNPDDWIYDPQALAQARASGAAFGTAGGTSAAGLSAAAMKAEQALGVIQNLRGLNEDGTSNDRYAQGRKDTFGTYGVGPLQIPDQWGFTMPGSAKADYASLLSQAGGQQFLTAYQGLRGTGAISEAEGAQAKDAVARMSTAQSDQAFQDALSDYERIIRKGYEVEKQKASSVGYGTDNAAPLPGATGTVLTYNPVTGNLE